MHKIGEKGRKIQLKLFYRFLDKTPEAQLPILFLNL
jgi:hypothetical protein